MRELEDIVGFGAPLLATAHPEVAIRCAADGQWLARIRNPDTGMSYGTTGRSAAEALANLRAVVAAECERAVSELTELLRLHREGGDVDGRAAEIAAERAAK